MEQKKRLGELLIDAEVIDETQLQAALGHQRRWGMKLGQALLDLKLAGEPQIVAALSRKFGYEAADLGALQPGPLLDGALKLVPREVAARHSLLPVSADSNTLTVAMADPTNIAVVDELSFRTGRRIKIAIAGERELAAAVRRLYFGEEVRPALAPIDLDESDIALETTGADDPFGALPDHLRERFVRQPAPSAPSDAFVADYQAALTPPPVLAPRPAAAARPPPAQGQRAAARPPPAPPAPAGPAPAAPAAPTSAAAAPATPAPLPDAESEVVNLSDLLAPAEEAALHPREVALADAVARLTRNAENPGGPAVAAVVALVRLLVKRGVFTEVDFLEELGRK